MGNTTEVVLRFKGENAQALAAIRATNSALVNMSTGVGAEIGKMQTRSKAVFSGFTSDLTVFSNRIPIASGAVRSLANNLDELDQIRQRTGRGLSSLVGPAALIAVGAAISAISRLGGAMAELLESSAKLGGEIFDLTQKTGLSAERYTALKFATEQAGGSVDKFNNGIKLFALTITDANKGTDQAIDKLKRLGVEPRKGIFDLDAALNKALGTIAKAPSGIVQMSLAADAFGRKIGPDLLPTIVSFDGNLDALTDRARRLGATLTDLEAKELDDFGDALDTLKTQATLLAARFTAQVAPEITNALQRISARAGENKNAVEDWGKATADVFRGIRVAAESDLGRVIGKLSEVFVSIQPITLALKGLASLGVGARATDPRPDPFGPGGALRGGRKNLPGTPEFRAEAERRAQIAEFRQQLEESNKKTGRGGGSKSGESELQRALREAQLVERATKERIEGDISENKRALDQQARDIEDFTKRAIEQADEQLNATIDRVNAEFEAYRTALDKKKIARDEFERKDRELSLQTKEAVRKNNDEVFALEAERDRKLSEAELAGNQRSLEREDEARQRIIERIQRQIDQRILLESEGERRIADVIDEGFKRRIEALREEGSAVATSADRKAFITDELIRLDGDRAGAAEAAANRIVDAIEREIQAERRIANELKEVHAIIREIELQIAEETIRVMEANFATRRDIRRARRELELAEEGERHRLATESINRQKEETDKEIELLKQRIESLTIGTTEEIEQHERLIRSLEALRQKREQLNQQQGQENDLHKTRKRRVTDESEDDPLSGIGDAVESVGQTIADVFGATQAAGQQFGSILSGVFGQVSQAIGGLVQDYVLLGSTGPSALRKVLAVALASLSAEAAAKAIFYTAQGIADLFWNPTRAASSFAAAAMFASLAGVSAIAGRAVAGDLFQQKPGTNSSPASGGGPSSSTSRSAEPQEVNLDRPQRQTSVKQEMHIFVHAEPGRGFNDEVVRALVHDVRLNGKSVQVISDVAGGGSIR